MKNTKTILILSALIAALSLVAAGFGVFGQGQGTPVPFTTLRGDTVMIFGHGLYRYDSVLSASQVIGGDVVTLVLAVPLLLLSMGLTARGSLRGRLLLTGTLGYFLYTYMSISFLLAYNPLFLVYVSIFSLSLFAFVLALMSFDLKTLPDSISPSMPRKPIAAFFFLIGAFLLMLWLGKVILPTLLTGKAPYGLDAYSTPVIQAMDLGMIVPIAFLAGILWLRQSTFSALLAPVVLLKVLTMSAALTAMIIGQVVAGVLEPGPDSFMFLLLGLIDIVLTVWVLRNIREPQPVTRPAAVLA